MTLKSDTEFEEKLTCGLKNDMRNLANFYQKMKGRKCTSLKFAEELCVITLKTDAKFEEELTCWFKIDMRNLTNFDPITRKSKKFALQWAPFQESI